MSISKMILALSAIFAVSAYGQSIYWPNTDTSQYYYQQPSYGNSYNDDPYNDMMRDIQDQQMRDLQIQQQYQQQFDRGDSIDQSFYCSWITNNAKLQETCYSQ